jgi:hypothetical protein
MAALQEATRALTPMPPATRVPLTAQLGAKYFFFAVSLIMFAVYTWALYAGPGARNPDTKAQLPTSEHQRWTWWLSLGLVFANDPLFAAHLLTPSIGVAGFFAFCSFSFIVTLLFYWCVEWRAGLGFG